EPLSAPQVKDILEKGLFMVERSSDERQDFITSLATEEGLAVVRQIVETEFAKSYSVLGLMFQVHGILFLQLITNDRLLSSLALERQVGTIYNVIYGPSGRRAVTFFTQVTEHVIRMRPESSTANERSMGNDVSEFEETLLLVAKAFLTTLTLNQEAAIQTAFAPIVESLCTCYKDEDIFSGVASHGLQWVHDNIIKLKDVLSMGESLNRATAVSFHHDTQHKLPKAKVFQVDLPGELSAHGPRHDNDHASIPHIRLLPTINEIFSLERAEFLPARDPVFDTLDQHETGIRRLLDNQFRLLREDTAGLLRDSIRLILHNWDVLVHQPDWRLKRRILRDSDITPARIYLGVNVRQVRAGGKKGIEVDLEFDQPSRLKAMSPARRKQWWQNSQALKESPVVLALVDGEDHTNVSVTFFQVAKRDLNLNATPPASRENVPTPVHDDPAWVANELANTTSLDKGQATALVWALRREIALIQGPPGTGKSYVGIQLAKCLSSNRDLLDLGPILCVCYTPHALDQFLQGLLNAGIASIVRLGPRSAFPHLEALSIDSYKQADRGPFIRAYNNQRNSHHDKLKEISAELEQVCRSMETGDDASAWVEIDGPRSPEELLQADVWTLSPAERMRLHDFWHEGARDELRKVFSSLVKAYYRQKQNLTAIYHAAEARMLQGFQVIGVTTTMLANLSSQIRGVQAKILICEEAGEVLESHVLTALLPSVQHAILIGDHLQLRPRISTLRLSMSYDREGAKYGLDESLFERLADSHFGGNDGDEEQTGGRRFPVTQLNIQRRMHPSVANLVRETLYPKLQDHISTTMYPAVAGMKHRLFWLDHRNTEDDGDPSDPMHSKTNTWEVHMVISLVRHLLRQGKYGPGEIAVLTPYPSGRGERWLQGQRVVSKGSLLDALRLSTVDNFQGEEATVVIVSLVRSNRFRNCGFLKSPNRINVLLSRAKHGMYLIGDANTASTAPMWASVIELFEKNEHIGPYLELDCERHPHNAMQVSCPDDFSVKSPEGGCAETCGLRLNCGHTCVVKCHSSKQHNAVKCLQKCYRMSRCGHPCAKKCYEPCGPCTALVCNVMLPCGHRIDKVECSRMNRLDTVQCTAELEPCPPCAELCDSGCEHREACKLPCAVPCENNPCSRRCEKRLKPCGHQCPGMCGEPCPPSQFCQICAPHEVLQQQVDLLEFKTYREIDLNASPLIFLPCNHFYTVASLDGLLSMNDYFNIDASTGEIIGAKPAHWEMMPGSALKGCPECRRPLRDINRYSRILKRFLLDEFTRKFVTLASAQHAGLADKIVRFEKQVDDSRTEFLKYWIHEAGGSKSNDQARGAVQAYRGAGIGLVKKVKEYVKSVATAEQPLGKLNDMLASAISRQNETTSTKPIANKSAIQTGFGLRGQVLGLRLGWVVLRDWDHICSNRNVDHRIRNNLVQLTASHIKSLIEKCLSLKQTTMKANLLQERVEVGIYFALFSMLSLSNMRALGKTVELDTENKTRQRAQDDLAFCERLCTKLPKLLGYLMEDIKDARRTINDGTFYALVTSEEKRQVYRAMAEQFAGTGHWYYCQNNHPFTIGECGMPMEEARCPQCEAPVGGLNHQLAEGARPAEDMNREFGETELTEQDIREGMIMEELREEMVAGGVEGDLIEM
ncbi:P-loop containing nucleoside triphosphate hydrolase protein, partial [Aspergillus brunneoviolaceus CBS 621.78]